MKNLIWVILLALSLFPSTANAANRFWTGATNANCTNGTLKWDANSATNNCWASTTGGAGGQTLPGSADVVTFDSNSGSNTVLVQAPNNASGAAMVDISSITVSNFAGTLDFHNGGSDNNVTLESSGANFTDGSSGAAPVINMGSGTWTLKCASGTCFQGPTGTNFTANASTISYTATPTGLRTMTLGTAQSYGTVSISVGQASLNSRTQNSYFTFGITNASNGTIATLTLPTGINVALPNNTTLNITNTPTWAGTSSAPVIFNAGAAATPTVLNLPDANLTLSYVFSTGLNWKTASARTITLNNSYELGDNTQTNATLVINNPTGGSPGIIGGQ